MIESDLSTTLAETTATEKSAVVMQRQAQKMQKVKKTGPPYAHSMTVDVQLCLKLGVAEVTRNRRNREGYSGVQFVDETVKIQNMTVRTSSQ